MNDSDPPFAQAKGKRLAYRFLCFTQMVGSQCRSLSKPHGAQHVFDAGLWLEAV